MPWESRFSRHVDKLWLDMARTTPILTDDCVLIGIIMPPHDRLLCGAEMVASR